MKVRLLVAALAMLAVAQEPVKPQLTPTIITATRQVTLFTGLERQMLSAIQKKDKAALEAMLTDECAINMPDADPLAGTDWVDSVIDKDFKLSSFVVRQVSVTDLQNFAVVKFDRVQRGTFKGKNESGEFFVVDLWKKDGDSWKLVNRYVSRVSPVAPAAKPDGKQ